MADSMGTAGYTGEQLIAVGPQKRRPVVFWVSLGWLALVILAAVLAPWLGFISDPLEPSRAANQSPSWSHWFGTNQLGQDMFARAVWGGRLSLSIAGLSVGVGLVVGGLIGVVSGFFGGWLDEFLSSVVNVFLALPALVFTLFIILVLDERLGQRYWSVVAAITIFVVPSIARIARAQAKRFAPREFVQVARMLGARWPRVLFREVVPNVLPAMVSIGFLAVGLVIIAEGSLSFVGASVEAPNVTWGKILFDGKGRMGDDPHIVLITAGIVFCTLLALNFVGDELLKRLDVRESRI